MPTDGGMDKDVGQVCVYVYIYIYAQWILLSHKEEWNSAICNNMDELRNCHIEWSESEKDKCHVISLISGNLENWYKWTYYEK